MRKLLNNIVVKYLTFSASTLIGTAVDFVVLWICAHGHFEGSYVGEYIISPAISFEFATVANFTVAYFFIWKDRISKRSTKSYIKHFLGYNISCIGAFLIKMGFLLLTQWVVKRFGVDLDVLWCNFIALNFSGFFNFFMNENVVFRKKKIEGPEIGTTISDPSAAEAMQDSPAAVKEGAEREKPAETLSGSNAGTAGIQSNDNF